MGRRPFADVLRELAGGTVYDDLSAQLADVTEAVMMNRKAGTLTLKLKITPNGDRSVSITEDVSVKVPSPPRGASVFFIGEGGALQRNDPRQTVLPLRQVETEAPRTGPLKETATG